MLTLGVSISVEPPADGRVARTRPGKVVCPVQCFLFVCVPSNIDGIEFLSESAHNVSEPADVTRNQTRTETPLGSHGYFKPKVEMNLFFFFFFLFLFFVPCTIFKGII